MPAIGGKRGTAAGAVIGVGAGATICSILLANARHRDRIIAAQMAAAADPSGQHTATWTDDNGRPVAFIPKAGEIRTIDAARLTPVRYPGPDGTKLVSPPVDTGGRECRL